MKRRRFLSLALALMLIISLCACKTKVVDDSTDATHGNAPVTGQKRDETTTAPPQTTKAPENTTLAQRKTEKGKLDPNTGTYTGLSPLPKIKLTATDPQNTRGLSTATVGYSYGVSKNGVPHQNSTNAQKYFDEKGFNAVSIDTKTKEKVLYLTFDCGYENGNTPAILDALQKHQAPAAFFVVGNFLSDQPDLVKRMAAEGHIVGNHTWSHPDMSKISTQEAFSEELNRVSALYQETTSQEMVKFYRPPQGKYSTQNLQMAKDLGYQTFFWSLAYVDWYQDQQPTHEEAFKKLTGRIHPGAIVLLHNTSSTNAEILDELLTKWEEMGYSFGSLDQLASKSA